MHSNYLLIGHGDIALRTAGLLNERGDPAMLVGRRPIHAELTSSLQLALMADLDQPESLSSLPIEGSRVLYLAPPPETGVRDSRLRHFCEELSRRLPELPRGVVYLSTSGVYGDCAGALVAETRPVNPQTDRARRRLDAELVIQQWGKRHQVPIIILRVAGIYGPGRLPLQRLRAGMPVLRPELAPASNRIHADDLARICLSALDQVDIEGIYNVCDGEQSNMSEYFLAVARVFDLPSPQRISLQEAQQQFSAEMLSYLNESRQLDNSQLLKCLDLTLQYPTLEKGLRAIRRQVGNSSQCD